MGYTVGGITASQLQGPRSDYHVFPVSPGDSFGFFGLLHMRIGRLASLDCRKCDSIGETVLMCSFYLEITLM